MEQSSSHRSPDLFSRYLAIAWCVLTVYGSLYPFSGWEGVGSGAFEFVFHPWPRYWTVFDLVVNVVVYIPLGFLATLAFRSVPGRFSAPVLGTLLAILVSFSVESAQTWLPSRIASNVDWGSNSLGGLVGSLLAFHIGPYIQGAWRVLRQHCVAAIPHVDVGLTLVGVWLITLLSPETLLFGVGDVRHIFTWVPSLSYSPETYRLAEATVVLCNFVAVGWFVGAMTSGRWWAFLVVPVFFMAAVLVRSLGLALLAGPENFLLWWTPGVQQGLTVGVIVLAIGLLFSGAMRLILAALALMLGMVVVNLAPVDPYSQAALALWRQGHFLNFNGLTRWVSTIWPLMALGYLMLVRQKT